MGMPAVFIRSSLCNLHCSWCDTDYTWNWKGTPWKHENDSLEGYQKFEKSEYIVEPEYEAIHDMITDFGCANLIITGGEPLLQQDAWIPLLKKLRETDPEFRFEVETNGTQTPSDELVPFIEQFNVSPKLANSGNSVDKRINAEALAFFAQHPNSWFKFVIAEESDMTEVNQIIDKHQLPKHKIILMPEGRTRLALNSRRGWLADLCIEQGYRFGDRLHIRLWGAKRGV